VLAGETTILGAAVEFASAAFGKLAAAMLANPFVAAAAAITVAIGALGAWQKVVEENRKATI
jgi:hypothetical protein